MNSQVVYSGNPPLDTHKVNSMDSRAMSYTRSISASSTPNGEMKTPPASKKPSIPAQLVQRRNNSFSSSSRSKLSPTGSSHSSAGGYPDAGSCAKSSVIFDAQGHCTCCPFGYHVDIDFVNFSQDAQSPTTSITRPTYKSKMSFDSQSPPHTHPGVPSSSSLFLDDHATSIKPVSVDVTQATSKAAFGNYPVVDSPIMATSADLYYEKQPNGQPSRLESNDPLESMSLYSSQVRTTRRSVTSTQLAETMATHLPDHGGAALTISPESVEQIKKHMALSLQRMQELEEQIKIIPLMQERISRLKVDKKGLADQLAKQCHVSSMRSIGVGNYDVDEEMTKIEKVVQTVVKEAPPKPSASIGVGNYDVNIEYLTEDQAYYTLAEKLQRIKEKEIQTWIQEAETAYAEKKAAMRSCGVGDGDVTAPEVMKVKETEIKTVYIEPDKPDQRNVGLQVKPSMRDVCIEFSQSEEKPSTRTCGFNVDVNDLMVEMHAQHGEFERTEFGELQQGGAMNAWQMQKHVIQRKFMDAMHKGTQKDLILFITSLLKRSVRSVGTTVKPAASDFGMATSSHGLRGTDVGVGDDTVNVTVKPTVKTRESFCMAKPVTHTQPTWTDLILTCDSATNTQSADTIERHSPMSYFSTTLELRPIRQYLLVKELYTGRQDQHNASKSKDLKFSSSRTSPTTSYISTTETIISKSSTGGPSQRSVSSGLTDGDSNSQSAQYFSVTAHNKDRLTLGMESAMQANSNGEGHVFQEHVSQNEIMSQRGYSSSDKTGTDQARNESRSRMRTAYSSRGSSSNSHEAGGSAVEDSTAADSSQSGRRVGSIKPGEMSKEYVQGLLFPSGSTTTTVVSSSRERTSLPGVDLEGLRKPKPDVSKDSVAREMVEKVSPISVSSTASAGIHTTANSGNSFGAEGDAFSSGGGTFSSGGGTFSSEGATFSSGGGTFSSGGATFNSEGDAFSSGGGTFRSGDATFSSEGATFSSGGGPFSSGGGTSSSGDVTSSSSGSAVYTGASRQERKELANSSVTSSSGNSTVGVSSVSRHVTSGHDDHGNFMELIEETESADGSNKKVVREKILTSFSGDDGKSQTQFPRFSDYFAKGEPPKGRNARMQTYENSSYHSRTTAEEERNKIELPGDPFINRHIDGQVSPHLVVERSSLESEEDFGAGRSPRSIMRKDSSSQGYNRSISFAEEAEVAQVVEEAVEVESPQRREIETLSDEEESEVSFDEGTYDGRHGDVSYHCKPEKVISKARSHEEIDIDVELQAACSIVQQHIESGDSAPNSKMTSALSVIQQDWFKVASGQQASVREVDGYMACFEDFSTELLEHIINMADGNGNTVLHYAVSHCNFPIVSLIVETGVADVNLQNKAGYTPIMLAALSEVNTDSDRAVIQQLLSKGNVNLTASQAGQTALMLAVSHARLEMVQLLLESGADINLQDEDGSTALMCATEHGHVDIVKTLLTHPDIDLDFKDSDGSTALEIALENSQKEIGMLLYAKDQTNKANSMAVIKKRTTRIPGSSSRGGQKSSSSEELVNMTEDKTEIWRKLGLVG
ncbi:KN motif and ankyrin repeat domain-containing protein 1-like isoform X2 [Watersipora subatra]|uniref:KN motif and ankyrin repeat domain-containing protein 1-like isoform X2 n=1 Tax=Watersipora subatra TaxID=2589382 RepID=UPI00355B8278